MGSTQNQDPWHCDDRLTSQALIGSIQKLSCHEENPEEYFHRFWGITMFRFRSLNQRMTVYMLLPVATLLFIMGSAGFIYARNRLLTQWGEAAILKLQRAAHYVDMRLKEPKELFRMFHKSAVIPHSAHLQSLLLDQLRNLDGVVRLSLTWFDEKGHTPLMPGKGAAGNGVPTLSPMKKLQIMPFHGGAPVDVTPPAYDTSANSRTISLISMLKDGENRTIGRLEVVMRFDSLVDTIQATGWWQSQNAYLVDSEGVILTGNLPAERKRLGETGDSLERATLRAMKSMSSGTMIGSGFPPGNVSGFYRLSQVPWTLVLVSPGKEILAPVVHFQYYFFFVCAGFIVLILLLIRFVAGRTVFVIRSVSEAAGRVVDGDYTGVLEVKSRDEVGELVRSFNTMVVQLKDRVRLKYSMNLAVEVQRNLLPGGFLTFDDLDIAATSIYCDETGGDYYDFIQFPEFGRHRLDVAVGDVTGHGIGAALLMTTARALIRARAVQNDDLAGMAGDVNRLLHKDTDASGNFMTLFYMSFDTEQKRLQWVRAGHEPALLYDPLRDCFDELYGAGIALGVDDTWHYDQYCYEPWIHGQIIMVGTDGLWEAENPKGERFGKARIRDIIRRSSSNSAKHVLYTITRELYNFQEKSALQDDVTLVVVKVRGKPDSRHYA